MSQHKPIQTSKEILGGVPVFSGTRVAASTLIDYLIAGDKITDFLEDFPTVKKKQVTHLLQAIKSKLIKPT